MSSTLARLRGETERLKSGRRIYVSSEPVAAYKVANNKKQLLQGDHPFVLALSDDDYSRGTDFSLLEASIGPELHWTLTSINHVLRTVSKYGEPTYLFANIVDTDPQAFVAVTLNRRTPRDELDHLEGVISRVCNFHVAESKPVQVPGPDQVIGALGKGLAKLVFGGGSSKSKDKEKDRRSRSPSSSPDRTDARQRQQQQYAWLSPAEREKAEQIRSEKERFDYLSSLEQRRGQHVASATGSYDRYGRQEEGEDVPTAPKMPTGRTAMGVGSKAEADARLAALKAEMRGEGGAPDVSSYRDSRPSAYPSIPVDNTRTPPADWQAHKTGTLSNPFTGGSSRDAGGFPPNAPHTMSYEDYLGRDEQWGDKRHNRSSQQPSGTQGKFYESGVEYTQSGDPVIRSRQQQQEAQYGRRDQGASYGDSDRGGYGAGYMGYEDRSDRSEGYQNPGGLSDREQRRLKYEQEAREAREEWDRAQREAAARRAAAESAPAGPGKPRVRYHEVKYDTAPYDATDGGWGDNRKPAYAYAGGGGSSEQGQGQEKGGKKKGMPSWLEMLGNVYAGGPDL